jgi:hypothetical protein
MTKITLSDRIRVLQDVFPNMGHKQIATMLEEPANRVYKVIYQQKWRKAQRDPSRNGRSATRRKK